MLEKHFPKVLSKNDFIKIIELFLFNLLSQYVHYQFLNNLLTLYYWYY